jgi:hypothetical protein
MLVAAAMCISVAIGAYYGRVSSPRYKTRLATIGYLANHYKVVSYTDDDIVLELTTPGVLYRYSQHGKCKRPEDCTLTESVVTPKKWIGKQSPFEWNEESIESAEELARDVIAPLVSALTGESYITHSLNAAARILESTEPVARPFQARERAALYVTGAVVSVSGGYIGYKLTYDPNKYFDNAVVLAVLADTDIWKSYANLEKAARYMKETYDNLAVLKEVDPKSFRSSTMNVNGKSEQLTELQERDQAILASLQRIRARGNITTNAANYGNLADKSKRPVSAVLTP